MPPKSPVLPQPWRAKHLLWAPHRLGFFLAVCLLLTASGWWALVQLDRLGWGLGLTQVISPSLVHAAVMTFGFMPLFFAGFLFTAGPKWLGVAGPSAPTVLGPLLLQFVGWLLWMAGAHISATVAMGGAALAMSGLAWMYWLFWRLVWASPAADRLHAKAAGCAGVLGVVALLAMVLATAFDHVDVALAAVKTGLWGFVVATFVAVLHRMLPFFTSSALPLIEAWRPFWVFWFLLGVVAMELTAVWEPLLAVGSAAEGPRGSRMWMLTLGLGELAAGSVVLWLAVVWGLVQSMKIRLLAMLHLGFLWLSLSLILSGASQLLGVRLGVPVLGLGALHALTMGFLGSLMLAMVTRVACGHSGRTLVADNLVWGLFWLLQTAVLVRIVSSMPGMPGLGLAVAALLWTLVLGVWGLRLVGWFGRPRADGRPD